MTPKDYRLIAETLYRNIPDTDEPPQMRLWLLIVDDFIRALKAANPDFDEHRFTQYCISDPAVRGI